MPKCFVISPFGRPGSPERAMADKILNSVIRAALGTQNFSFDDGRKERDAVASEGTEAPSTGRSLTVERADETKAKYGQVMERVALSIVNDDLVVAVLWRRNPNVYYELAIAHAAARPVVILKSTDEDVPFDVLGQHFITFDPARIESGDTEHIEQVVGDLRHAAEEAISAFEERRRSHTQIAFNSLRLDPLGRQHNQYVVHENFRKFSYEDWSRSINEARKFVRFAGVSLFDLTRIDNNLFRFPNGSNTHLLDLLMVRILIGGIDAHVLLMDEDNPGLEHMLHTGASSLGIDLGMNFSGMFLEHVRQEIMVASLRWTDFAERVALALERTRGYQWPEAYLRAVGVAQAPGAQGSFRISKIKRGLLYSRLSMTDREAIITPFFFEFGRNGSGPAVHTFAGTPLYEAHRKDYEYLVRANSGAAEPQALDAIAQISAAVQAHKAS